jgi:hypothetical protein
MNLQRFEELALAYGADIARWPMPEQDRARQLAAADTHALDALARAAQLDGLLHSATLEVADAEAARVVQRSLERTAAAASPLRPRWRIWPAAVLVGAALVGCTTARERPQWLGLPQAEPARGMLAEVFDADSSRF